MDGWIDTPRIRRNSYCMLALAREDTHPPAVKLRTCVRAHKMGRLELDY